MKYAIFFGVSALWFLFGSLISGWIDGYTVLANTRVTIAADTTDTSVNVTSTRGFPAAPNYIIWDNEVSVYTSVTSTSFNGLTRGATHPTINRASQAAAHAVGASVLALEASVIDSLVGFNYEAISTSYGSFGIIDFGVATWNFFKNLPRLWLFDYAFLKGSYNTVTGTNNPSDIVLLRIALICMFTVPGFVMFALLLRQVFFG